jgi:hypothetical protein
VTLLTALARAEAAAVGRARRIRTVRHVHLSDRPLVVIPLQLAGEACAPLAVMVGDDPDKPRLLTVYEPRDRGRRFEFAADLAEVILGHLDGYLPAGGDRGQEGWGLGAWGLGGWEAGAPNAGSLEPPMREASPGPGGADPGGADPGHGHLEPFPDAPQLVVPNPNAARFLRLLGRSARFRRTDGEYPVRPTVPVLGRWLTHYAERAEVPGSALMLPMTTALAEHWATGQSDVEDANLAALLGWIDPPPGQTGQQAARAAEDPLRCPPAGPATDPTFDNEVLQGRMQAIRDAALSGDTAAMHRAQAAMDAVISDQLTPTWDLMWRGYALLAALPEAQHVAEHWSWDRRSFTDQVQWQRAGGAPQARRDNAVSAARRLASLERTAQRVAIHRAYDDPLVMAEYRLTGDAFTGTVIEADPTRQDTNGKKARLRPWITVETADEVLAEPDTVLRSPARPSQEATVIAVTAAAGRTRVVLELEKGMGRSLTPIPGSVPAVGDEVTYTTLKDEFQPSPDFPSREQTPWTHGGPPPEHVPTDDDAWEDQAGGSYS